MAFTQSQIETFSQQGFLIERQLASAQICETMLDVIAQNSSPPLAPVEFEVDVQYPGSPVDRDATGGDTPRRLLHAYTRDQVFRNWATSGQITDRVKQLLISDEIAMSQNHHNCIMTKHPGFSSSTSWHQDIRYWLFDQPNLVSVWLALGHEREANGGMQLIPGTHAQHFDRGRYDAAFFLRKDLPENQTLIDSAVRAELHPGDVLFFHSGTFHAAGKNQTEQTKYSLVFTYRSKSNQPIAGTRSANFPDIFC